jgi:hypothetical protein
LPSFPVEKQSKIIMACMALHNFIRQSGMMDDLFHLCDENKNYDPNDEETPGTSIRTEIQPEDEDESMNEFHDWIANSLMSRL